MKGVTLKKRISAPSFYLTFRNLIISRSPWSAIKPPAIHALTDDRQDLREVESLINRRREVFGFNEHFPKTISPKPQTNGELVTAGASEDHNRKTNRSESHNKSLKVLFLELSFHESTLGPLDLNKCPSSFFFLYATFN